MAPSTQNPLIIHATAQSGGTYTVVPVSDKGCNGAPAQTQVKVLPKVVASVSDNTAICAGESTQLKASGGLYYQWTPSAGLDHDNIANPVASPAQTTTYSVKVSNDGCFDDTKSVTVTVNSNPVANAGKEKVLFAGQSAQLDGSISGDNITGFYWSPTNYLSNPLSLTPTASPPHDMTYTLTVLSGSCGQATSEVLVRVYQKITIPNTFTPNGDGVNDYWNIDALITYPQSLTTVFTRDGQQVFKSVGYVRPWDGTNHGKQVPAGTYYYTIDLRNGQPPFSGWVLVSR
jgi:gliding motility-associated-like protein